jgi:hypothetical protein
MKEYIDSLPEQLKVLLLSIYLMQKSKPNLVDYYGRYLQLLFRVTIDDPGFEPANTASCFGIDP